MCGPLETQKMIANQEKIEKEIRKAIEKGKVTLYNGHFYKIVRKKIEGKNYDITLIKVISLIKLSYIDDYILAYVYLDKNVKRELSCCTYHHGNIYGIDTAHYYNTKMTLEQKESDAVRQITELIKDYGRKK